MKNRYKNSTIDTRMEDTFCVSVYTGSYRMCGYTADTLSHMFWAVSRFYLGRNGVKCVAVSERHHARGRQEKPLFLFHLPIRFENSIGFVRLVSPQLLAA